MSPDDLDRLRAIFHPLVLDVEAEAYPVITIGSLAQLEASR